MKLRYFGVWFPLYLRYRIDVTELSATARRLLNETDLAPLRAPCA